MSNGYKAALQRFEDAVRAHEMKGSQMPQSHFHIEKEYQEAKQALITKLAYRSTAKAVREPEHGPNCGCHYCT